MAAFQAAARKTILGPKTEIGLEDADGNAFWFRPKKYPVLGSREIQSVGLRTSRKVPRALRTKLREFATDDGTIDMEAAEKVLTEAEKTELENLDLGDVGETSEVLRLQLIHGVGTNNFSGEERPDIDSSQADVILEFVDVFDRILKPIQDWNRPLAPGKSESSETL